MALTLTYAPTSGWTTPTYPVYNDQTHLLTSTNANRNGFKAVVDLYIDQENVTTLNCYPFNGTIQVNPQLAKDYVGHDFNYDLVGLKINELSYKDINFQAGESYSRQVSYTGITTASTINDTYVVLKFPISTDLRVNDRLYLVPDDPTINPQYQNYWKVITVANSAKDITIDCSWVASPTTETGKIYEGVEMIDFAYSTGGLNLYTTNPHRFNVGDKVSLVMDGYSTTKIELTGGTTGGISVFVGGVRQNTATAFNTDLATTAADLTAAINSRTNVPNIEDYVAYNIAGSPIVHIYSKKRTDGAATAGLAVTVSLTGDMGVRFDPTMFVDMRTSVTGQGWNPQFTNIYNIKEITSTTSFTLEENLINPLSNQYGSQRGTFIASNNYIFDPTLTSTTYQVLDCGNLYEYVDFETEIEKHNLEAPFPITPEFLSNKPDDSYKFCSDNEIDTLDILTKKITGQNLLLLNITVYSGDTDSGTTYSANFASTMSGLTNNKYYKLSFGTGVWNLNNLPTSIFFGTPPVQPMINSNVTKYVINVTTLSSASQAITYNRCCSDNNYFQVLFLNKWGSYDSWQFKGNYIDRLNVTRSLFDKKREQVLDTYNYGINLENRGKTVFNVNSVKQVRIFSDWLNESEANWLYEIFESPDVYIYQPKDGNPTTIDLNVLRPANLTDEEITQPNEKSRLRLIEITAQISNKRINQGN